MFRSVTSLVESEAQVGFLFHVMIGTNPLGEFRSVKGIGRTVDAEEIREGGRNHSPHTRVGHSHYKRCVIEWGMSNRTTLYDWIHAVEAGYGYKRQVWVVQLARDRMPLRIYQLVDAWPVEWEGAELDANNNVVDTEQITLAYEAVMLVTMPSVISSLPSFEVASISLGDTLIEDDGTELSVLAGEEPEAEEQEAEEATSELSPAPTPLKLSGGLLFAPTVFEAATLVAETRDGEAEDAELGSEPVTDDEPTIAGGAE